MEFEIFLVLIIFAAIIFVVWANTACISNALGYDYWKKLGVVGPKPSVFVGNFGDIFFRKKPPILKIQEFYNNELYRNKPFFGYFEGTTPILVINDPDLINRVLIKDFNVFCDRGIKINERVDPLSAHLFNISGERWKVLRPKLTPVFTASKLKRMFHSMTECADNFEIYLKDRVAKNESIECREHAARYGTDFIGSCAFGIETRALADEDSVFRKMGRKIFEASFSVQIKRIVRQFSPPLYNILQLNTAPTEITEFFINTVKNIIQSRETEQFERNDFMDVIRYIPDDNAANGFEWTDELLIAQAFVFFVAGFEMPSATISFALWELARNSEVQEKLRREVLEFDRTYDGKLTYESVNEMKYLDMVVKETLRKNPPAVILKRKVMQDYVIPETNVKLPKGQIVQIPAYCLHHDPKYYPNPEVFDPERFTTEAKRSRHPILYLPFGNGPKKCIGSRFAYYQVKLALIKVMKNFRVHKTTNTDGPYVIDKNYAALTPVGGIVLKFERLNA